MATQLTAEDARNSLNAHVAARGREIHEKFGPHIGWEELRRILEDRASVRVHPHFQSRPERVCRLVLVNYGEFAGSDDGETFGAAVLGLPKENYYRALCDTADELAGIPKP